MNVRSASATLVGACLTGAFSLLLIERLFRRRPLAEPDAVRSDDVHAYLEGDRRFHQAFISAVGNPVLTQTAMAMRDKMRLYGVSSRAGRERQAASVAEHYKMIELAMAGDVKAITGLVKEHIRTWEPIFVEGIQKSGRQKLRARG